MVNVDAMQLGLLAAFCGVLLIAAASDLRSRRIPNVLCLTGIALYPFVLLTGFAPTPWWGGLAVGLAVFAAGAPLFALGAFGGGDVKLVSVAAVWAGPALVAELLLATALAGGALALVGLLRLQLEPIGTAPPGVGQAAVLPYGVAIAAGGCWAAYRLSGV